MRKARPQTTAASVDERHLVPSLSLSILDRALAAPVDVYGCRAGGAEDQKGLLKLETHGRQVEKHAENI